MSGIEIRGNIIKKVLQALNQQTVNALCLTPLKTQVFLIMSQENQWKRHLSKMVIG